MKFIRSLNNLPTRREAQTNKIGNKAVCILEHEWHIPGNMKTANLNFTMRDCILILFFAIFINLVVINVSCQSTLNNIHASVTCLLRTTLFESYNHPSKLRNLILTFSFNVSIMRITGLIRWTLGKRNSEQKNATIISILVKIAQYGFTLKH